MADELRSTMTRLGARLEAAWREISYDEVRFPELARAHLADARLHEAVDVERILDWAFGERDFPPQADPGAAFGQPPLTLYSGRRFYVDVLFWVDGTTRIHQHAFSGAFQVLSGSSIHTRYAFDEARRVNAHLRLGQVRGVSSEMLRPGDVRVITGGRDLIHALFHLERPTASIVVRTEGEADVTPQLDYWPPAVATDDDAEEPWQRRLAQLTDLLVTTEDPSIERRLTHVMREEDLATCFLVLRRALRHRDARVLGRLLATLGGRDADAARAFDAALGEMKRVGSLVARRAQLVDPSTRLLLAVLLNAPDRRTLLELFASIDPSRSPVEALVDALRIASSVEAPLQFRGVAWSPNVLGLPSPVEGWEEALRAELEGRDGLSRSPAVEAYLAALRAAPSLAPLFRV